MTDNDPPPRPKRIDYPDSRAYHRAYERWRARYDPKRKAAIAARSQAYQEKHRERLLAEKKVYYEENRHEIRAKQNAYATENRDKYRARHRAYYEANAGIVSFFARVAKGVSVHAVPLWLTREQWLEINAFYEEARRMTEATGIPHVVDHIEPLRGPRCCGLHVPWNLQVVTDAFNARKGHQERK